MVEWAVPGAGAVLFLLFLIWQAHRNTRRMIERTLKARRNLSESEFMALLEGDASDEARRFMWDTVAPLVQPDLTPHPDDHLWLDLPIEEEEPLMDWWPGFASRHKIDAKDWPNWPEGWECTVRNYARWLDLGLRQAGRPDQASPM